MKARITYTKWDRDRGGKLVLRQARYRVIGRSHVVERAQAMREYAAGMATSTLIVVAIFVVLLTSGCGGIVPPQTITVSPDLPEGVQIAAARARDAWCAAPVNWCPELVESGGEGWIRVDTFPEQRNGAHAYNDGHGMVVLAPGTAALSAEELTGIIMHEFGHYGIDGHVHASELMKDWFANVRELPLEVDPEAVAAWCNEQGCGGASIGGE